MAAVREVFMIKEEFWRFKISRFMLYLERKRI